MVNSEIVLETKFVGDIKGKFYIPSYQRGYRWGEQEVVRLLEDIYQNGKKNYCLQPIVVKNQGDLYELIDGQQRLTTLYLIYKYMSDVNPFYSSPKFSLEYETRNQSADFLKNIDISLKEENIDFWHIINAYETIKKWFEEDLQIRVTHIFEYLKEDVKVIWYEVDATQDAIALFTRLNIGKIPLTSAELVKAMFLSQDNNVEVTRERQEEISLQWDNIEKALHNASLWGFLSNSVSAEYRTRIDLILEMVTGKKPDMLEKYYTYFAIDKMKQETSLYEIWKNIQHTYLILKDWYEDHELYHKIGYLVASKTKSLQDIFNDSNGKTKTEFKAGLDMLIKDSIAYDKPYEELSYDKSNDWEKINKLLLLFNVESVRQIDEQAQRFPFDRYKYKSSWSLEHIHAQQSQGMKKQEEWKEWLRLHIKSLQSLPKQENLILLSQNALQQEKLERIEFEKLQEEILDALSVDGNSEYLHSISNMALLEKSDNAALNNSTFDVKRNIIVDMDKQGKYIPFCTKMVFLKYYTPSELNQIHFWGQADRIAYVNAINDVLKKYLKEEISLEKAKE